MAVAVAVAVLSIGTIIVIAASGGDSNAEPTTTIEEVSNNNKNNKKGNQGAVSEPTEPKPTPTKPTPAPTPAPTDPPTTPPPPPPTTPAPPPPTTVAPQPTEPNPTPSGDAERSQKVLFPTLFELTRQPLLEALEEDVLIQSVDRFEYDPEDGTIFLVITPAFDYDEGVRDDAWTNAVRLAEFWINGLWVDPDSGWSPNFDNTITSAHYRCTGDQMQKIQRDEWRRSNWEEKCRIS